VFKAKKGRGKGKNSVSQGLHHQSASWGNYGENENSTPEDMYMELQELLIILNDKYQ
jgi:hypothetical protein